MTEKSVGVEGWITGVVSKTNECGEGYVEVTMILRTLYRPEKPFDEKFYVTPEEHAAEGEEWAKYDRKVADYEARERAKDLLHLGHARIYQVEDGLIQG